MPAGYAMPVNYYTCPTPNCTYYSPRREDLILHTRNYHTSIRAHTCPHSSCGKAFGTSSHLAEHVRGVHDGARPHACDVPGCGYAAATPGNLTKHQKTHFSVKTFECGLNGCRKVFGKGADLKVHQAGHA